MAVVDIINSQTCKDPFTMTFVRRLVTTTLLNNILFRAKHVLGKQNQLCDLLSRALVQEAREIAPLLDLQPTTTPLEWLPT